MSTLPYLELIGWLVDTRTPTSPASVGVGVIVSCALHAIRYTVTSSSACLQIPTGTDIWIWAKKLHMGYSRGPAPGRTDVQLCGVPVCLLCEVLCIVYLLCMEYLAQYTASCIFTSLDTTGEPSTRPVANSNTVYEPLYVFFPDTQIGYSKLFWPTLFTNTTLILHTTSVYVLHTMSKYIYIYN